MPVIHVIFAGKSHLGRVALLDDPGNERELEYVFCWGALGAIFFGFRLHVNKWKPCSLRIFGDVMGFQKIQNPFVLRPFSGCHERRVWCFHGTGFLGLVASNGWSPGFIVWHTKFREKPFWGGLHSGTRVRSTFTSAGVSGSFGIPFLSTDLLEEGDSNQSSRCNPKNIQLSTNMRHLGSGDF